MSIRQNLNCLGGLILVCELINKLLPEQEDNPKVWEALVEVINQIKNGKINQIVKFEAELLNLLGFGTTDEEKSLMTKKDWKNLHIKLNRRLEAVVEKPFKSLAIFK